MRRRKLASVPHLIVILERDAHRGALVRLAFERHARMVEHGAVLYNGKPKSCSFSVFTAGTVGFVESIPYLGQAFFWNPHTVIFDRDKNFSVFYGGFYNNRGIVITELDGVVQSIVQYLLDLF